MSASDTHPIWSSEQPIADLSRPYPPPFPSHVQATSKPFKQLSSCTLCFIMPSFFTDTDCLTAQKQLHIVLNVVNLNPQPEKGSLCMISFKTSGAIISSTPKIKKKSHGKSLYPRNFIGTPTFSLRRVLFMLPNSYNKIFVWLLLRCRSRNYIF